MRLTPDEAIAMSRSLPGSARAALRVLADACSRAPDLAGRGGGLRALRNRGLIQRLPAGGWRVTPAGWAVWACFEVAS